MLLLDKLGLWLGVVGRAHGSGTANTSVVYHAGRLMALNEGDLPYAVRRPGGGRVCTVDYGTQYFCGGGGREEGQPAVLGKQAAAAACVSGALHSHDCFGLCVV